MLVCCSNCKKEKEDSEFYRKKTERNRLYSYCKKCFNEYCIKRWIEIKLKLIEYKGGSCIKCGYNKYYGALELHHRDASDKEFNWTKLRLKSWDKIRVEADKCDLLCANCHREVHQSI